MKIQSCSNSLACIENTAGGRRTGGSLGKSKPQIVPYGVTVLRSSCSAQEELAGSETEPAMRRHPLIRMAQEPQCLFLWSCLWWGKNISSTAPIWFSHDCISPFKAHACNQAFIAFDISEEMATCCTVFSHFWATWFYHISRDFSSRTEQAPGPGKGDNTATVGGAGAPEHHEPCRSQWCPGSRSMAHPSRDRIALRYCAAMRSWPDRMSVLFWATLNRRWRQTGVSSVGNPSQSGRSSCPARRNRGMGWLSLGQRWLRSAVSGSRLKQLQWRRGNFLRSPMTKHLQRIIHRARSGAQGFLLIISAFAVGSVLVFLPRQILAMQCWFVTIPLADEPAACPGPRLRSYCVLLHMQYMNFCSLVWAKHLRG